MSKPYNKHIKRQRRRRYLERRKKNAKQAAAKPTPAATAS
jgi:hypothetical protein